MPLNNLFELTIFLKCMIRHKHEKILSISEDPWDGLK